MQVEAGACTAKATGSWDAAGTWVAGCGTVGIPTAGDAVSIGAFTVTVNDGVIAVGGAISMTTTTSQLTVGQGVSGSLSATSIAFGAVANAAGLTVNSGAIVSLTGAVTLSSANAATSATIAGSGQLNTASVTVGSAVVGPTGTRTTTLTSTVSTFSISGAISTTCSDGAAATSRRVDPYINLSSGSMSVGTTITLCNSTNGTQYGRAFFQMNQGAQTASFTLSYVTSTIWTMGAGTLATTNLSGTGNTVTYSGATAQVRVTPYRHLILSNTNPNIGALTAINGNLTLSAGSASSVATAANITVGGALQINANNTLTIGNANTFTITGTTTVDGTLTVSTTGATEIFTGAVTVNGTLNLSNNTAAKTFSNNVIINSGSTWNNSANAAVNIAGSLTVNISNPTWGSGVHTMSGAGTSINAANGVSITIPNLTVSGTVTNNLTSTNSNILTVSTALAGGGTLTQATNAQLVISGSSGITTLTAIANPNLVTYNGSGAQTLKGTTYNDLTYSGSNTGSIGANTTVNDNLTVSSGVFQAGAYSLTVTNLTSVTGTLRISNTTGTKTFGDLTINTGGVMNFTAAEGITMNGNLTIDGTGAITGTTGAWIFQKSGGNGTIGGTTSSTQTIASATFTTSYAVGIPLTTTGNMAVTGTILTNNSTLTITGNLTGVNGTLIQGTNAALNLNGTCTITTLDASANGNTVTYTGSGAQTIDVPLTSYYNLRYSGSNTGTFGGILVVTGDFTISSGIVATSNNNLTLSGNFSNSGTFTAGTGTVTFTDATKTSTITNPASGTSFRNFTVTTPSKALVFDHIDQTNITGILTLNGQACNTMVTLFSDLPGTKFNINATGTKNVTFINVTDSNAVTLISLTDSKGYNYTNWSFGATTCGSLTLSAPVSATLSQVTLSYPSPNSTGNLGTVTSTDTRGTNVGWSLTATCGNFTGGGHTIPVINFTINPNNSTLSAVAGSLTGVSAGVSHTFSGTSDPANIITATFGNGTGQYEIDPDLTLSVPMGSYWGAYSATITLTVQ